MSILDFLVDAPVVFENNFLSLKLDLQIPRVYKILVLNVSCNPKHTQIKVKLLDLNLFCNFIFFNFKAYQKKIFIPNTTLFVKCLIQNKNGFLSSIQPKVTTEINQIKVGYKSKKIKIEKEICKSEILKFKLKTELIDSILEIHFPSVEFVDNFNLLGNFSEKSLNTLKFFECFNYLLKLASKKFKFLSKKVFERDCDDFVTHLPFTLTIDQIKALEDISADFMSKFAAKRIIVGDVGTGKTVLILASAFMAYPNRAVIMAPTTVLASQIYEEALKFLPKYLKVALFTNKSKPKNSLEEFHFIVGTHALLYEKLPEIDLLMIDEQHRFGTNQRNLIDSLQSDGLGRKPHFLQFSATPIPRTQVMIESNFIDFSFLKQTPFVKNIKTKIISKSDFSELLEHIKNQILLGYQTIIVYPLVEINDNFEYASIEKGLLFWTKNFEKVYATHGKDSQKGEILEAFRNDGNILLATTLIEVGISLPKLTSIVIVGAERMGLATLHQLRGRVSRNGLDGFCFLYTNKNHSEKLEKFAKTKSGFEIAELDLQLRDGGDLLGGKQQSGNSFVFLDFTQDGQIIEKASLALSNFKNH